MELYLGRSLGLLEESIEITVCALEAPTDPAVVQVQLWAAVSAMEGRSGALTPRADGDAGLEDGVSPSR